MIDAGIPVPKGSSSFDTTRQHAGKTNHEQEQGAVPRLGGPMAALDIVLKHIKSIDGASPNILISPSKYIS